MATLNDVRYSICSSLRIDFEYRLCEILFTQERAPRQTFTYFYRLNAKCLQFDWLKQLAYFWYFYLLSCKYQWTVKRKKTRRDILNISIYTNLKHTWYMYKYGLKQHLIVLKSDSVLINKILVTKFVIVKVSQNLNLMQSLSTQWNQ